MVIEFVLPAQRDIRALACHAVILSPPFLLADEESRSGLSRRETTGRDAFPGPALRDSDGALSKTPVRKSVAFSGSIAPISRQRPGITGSRFRL